MSKNNFLLFLLIVSFFIFPVSAYTVHRSIEFVPSEFNDATVYNKIEVTITPSDYEHFNNPGYYITEYIPSSLTFVSTNADWNKVNSSDNTISLMKFMPSANNLSIKYILNIPNKIASYTIYGIWKDENRSSFNSTTELKVNGNLIDYKDTSPEVVTTPIPTPTATKAASAPVPVPTVTIKKEMPIENALKAYQSEEIITDSKDINVPRILQILGLVLLLSIVITSLYKIKSPRKLFKTMILSVRNREVYLDDKKISMPAEIELMNAKNIPSIMSVKVTPNRNVAVNSKNLFIMPHGKASLIISLSSYIPDNFTNKVEIYQ